MTQRTFPCFSAKDYMLGQHAADEIKVTERLKLLGKWTKANRFRSIREVFHSS